MRWYRLAAAQGNSYSQGNIGSLYILPIFFLKNCFPEYQSMPAINRILIKNVGGILKVLGECLGNLTFLQKY